MTPEEMQRLEALSIANQRGLLNQRQSMAVQELRKRMSNSMPTGRGQMGRQQRYEDKPWTLGRGLRAANLSTIGMPVVNDIAGFLDDAYMYITDPESRTWGNAAMSAAGMLPFVSSASGIIAGRGAQTLKPETVEIAERMRDAGASRDEIWRATGEATGQPAFFDERGQLKFEIADSTEDFNVPMFGNTQKAMDARALEARTYTMPDEEIELFKELEGFSGTNDEWVMQTADRLAKEATDVTGSTYPFREVYKNEDVLAAYPDAGDITTKFRGASTQELFGRASYSPSENRITVLNDFTSSSSAPHELQHAIQRKEGFATGGSPDNFVGEAELEALRLEKTEEILNRMENQFGDEARIAAQNPSNETYLAAMERFADDPLLSGADPETKIVEYIKDTDPLYNRIYKENGQLKYKRQSPFEKYERLAGEAEARAVQGRLNMPMQERINKPFWESYDVPEDELIYRYE